MTQTKLDSFPQPTRLERFHQTLRDQGISEKTFLEALGYWNKLGAADQAAFTRDHGDRAAVDYGHIQMLFNTECKSFPAIFKLSAARKAQIRARLAEGYTYRDFDRLFQKAEASSFLKGGNGRNWRATFDWLIKDANMAKVLDGNYDDPPAPETGRSSASYDLDEIRAMMARESLMPK